MIRKMLKLKPIPITPKGTLVTGYVPKGTINGEIIPVQIVHPLMVEGVAVYPLGIKEDPIKDYKFKLKDGSEAEYYQEGL